MEATMKKTEDRMTSEQSSALSSGDERVMGKTEASSGREVESPIDEVSKEEQKDERSKDPVKEKQGTKTESKEVLLKAEHISKFFRVSGGRALHAVEDVNLEIYRGETLGLVGESGCGKSTLGRTLMGIYKPTKGKLYYDGKELDLHSTKARFDFTKKAQIVFQDPYASLDSRMTVGSIIEEGMEIHNMYDTAGRKKRVAELLHTVGLNSEHASRFPHEFSGGQRQRIGIARALAIEPEFIVCDEPISALDVSIQAQVINLLRDLQKDMHLTYLFIAHDLNIVKYISDRIAVMYLGSIMELASSEDLYKETLHPYSQALLSAVPIPDPDKETKKQREIISGDVPSPINRPKGCPFSTRCPKATERCKAEMPALREVRPNHFCACHIV